MKIDICELMNRRLDKISFEYRFDPRHTDEECVLLPEDIEIPDDGISVCGSITDSLGCMMFRAAVTVDYVTACARCLDEVHKTLEFEIERMVLTEKIAGNDPSGGDEDEEWDGELEDVLYVNEAKVIPDAAILEEVSLELPPFVLCREDCPGLCPKCGKRLADGDCGCKDEKEMDPRLAILQKLLDNPE